MYARGSRVHIKVSPPTEGSDKKLDMLPKKAKHLYRSNSIKDYGNLHCTEASLHGGSRSDWLGSCHAGDEF